MSLTLSKYSPSGLLPHLVRLSESPLICRLARGAFWSLSGALISKALVLASNVLVARMLGTEGFGKFGIIQSTIGMFGIFAGFGLGLTATKYVAEFRLRDPAKAGRILALSNLVALSSGAAMALAMVVAAPWLAARTLAAPELTRLLQISAALLLLSALNGAQTGALAGFEAFKSIARVNFIAGTASFPIMVGGVYVAGLTGAAWALVASMGVNWLLSHIAIRAEARKARVPLIYRDCSREAGILVSFSLPAVLSGLMVGPIKWGCSALLVNQPGGYAEMGIYSAAFIFHPILLFLGNTVGTPLLSMVSNVKSGTDDNLGRLNMLLTWGLSLIPSVVLLSFPEIAEVAFGDQFALDSFRHTFVLIVLFTCVVIYKQGLARVLAAHNLLWWGLLSNIVWGGSAVAGAFFLVRMGAVGLALAFAIAYMLNTIVFIPLYTGKGLVPRSTILSAEAGIVWFAICMLAATNWFDCSLPLRIMLFLLGSSTVAFAFLRLLRSNFTQHSRSNEPVTQHH